MAAHCRVCGSQAIDMYSSIGTQDPELCDRCFWMTTAQGLATQLAEAQSVTARLGKAIEEERAIMGGECRWKGQKDGSAKAECRPLDTLWGFNRGFRYCAYCGSPVVFVAYTEQEVEV